jgi:hypothetical protein
MVLSPEDEQTMVRVSWRSTGRQVLAKRLMESACGARIDRNGNLRVSACLIQSVTLSVNMT